MAKMFEGPTEAEAAIKACEELDIPRSQLKYGVLEKGNGRVVIEVDEHARVAPDRDGNRPPPRRDDRGGDRGPRRDHDRGPRGARGGRGGRDERRPRRGAEEDDFADRLAEEYSEFREMTQAPAVKLPPKPALNEDNLSERAEKALEATRKFLQLGGFDGAAQISVDTDEQVLVDIHGADEALIIGRKGETLMALQFVINRLVGKESEGPEKIAVDCEGYRERRQQALRALALKLGEKATVDGKIVSVTPMNAHDRRMFHVTLDGQNGLKTRSEGEGLFKRVLIIPAGAE